MNNKLIANIIENKPYFEEDAEYIKSIKLGIPIHVIDLSILKKEIDELPITYRIILKFVNDGIELISELANIMGLDQRIIEETLAAMSMQNLIYDIGSNIKITKNGKDALEKMKLIKIKEDTLKNILINAITMNLYSNDEFHNVTTICDQILREKEDITEEAIYQRFDEINELYKEEQKKMQVQYMGSKQYISKAISELKDIVSINKNKVIYECRKLFLYYKDGTIMCRIDNMNEKEEEIYLNEIYNQYATNSNILGVKYIKNNEERSINYLLDYEQLEVNKKVLEESINAYKEDRNETTENKVMAEYYTNRFLLDEEYRSILVNEINNFKGTIFIQIQKLSSIILDEEIFCSLKKLGGNKQEINIIYIKTDKKNINDRIKELRTYNINMIEVEKIEEDVILFDNKFAVVTYNKVYNIKEKNNYGIIKDIYTMYVEQDILSEIKKKYHEKIST